MTTSGTAAFIVTRDDIIRDAALLCNAIDAEVTMDPTMVTDFTRAGNMLIRTWRNAGMRLWKQREVTLFPAVGQMRYNLSLTSSDHCAETYSETTISTSAVLGETVLQVDSITGMSAADKIGILLDDGTLHWTTIVSTGGGPVVTITTGLASAASAIQPVYWYTSNIVRPLRVDNTRRYHIADTIEIPIDLLARRDYDDVPLKAQEGIPFRCYFDLQRSAAYFTINNVPTSIADFIRFTATLPVEDLGSTTANPDFPEEWYLAIVFGIAKIKKFAFNVPAARRREIDNLANEYLGMAAIEDREEVSVYFSPDFN